MWALLRDFLKLGRPHFLIGGLLLHGLGVALATLAGAQLNWQRYAWSQTTITAAQWMTHYCNDYYDVAADRANLTPTRWSGGSRVLVSGVVPHHAALMAAAGLGLIALSSSIALALLEGSPPFTLPLTLVIIALSWFYSAPPLRLASRGLGELTTALVVTLLTPLLGFYVQLGKLEPSLPLACFPLCCLQFAMLLTIEFPDAAGDIAQGKRTLVVRFGPTWSARSVILILALAFGSLPTLALLGLPTRVAAWALLPLPLAVWQAISLARGAHRDPRGWEGLAFRAVLLFVAMMLAELLGAAHSAQAP